MQWGTRIFDLARERGWSDVRLARELGVARTTLWRLRYGVGEPSPQFQRKAYDLFPEADGALFWPLPASAQEASA